MYIVERFPLSINSKWHYMTDACINGIAGIRKVPVIDGGDLD